MAEPITVLVKDELGTTTTQSGGSSSNSKSQSNNLNSASKENKKASTTSVIGSMIALKSINYITSNVGKWTGNTRNQQTVNNVKQLMGYGIAFAVNPVLGAVSVALDGMTTALDSAHEEKLNRVKTEIYQNRYGGKGGYRR